MTSQHKKTFIALLTVCLIMVLPMLASAQFDATPGDPESAPIDGGLSLLVAAGVGYGAKKLKERKRNITQ